MYYLCMPSYLLLEPKFSYDMLHTDKHQLQNNGGGGVGGYELLNPGALKVLMLYKNQIFQCMG